MATTAVATRAQKVAEAASRIFGNHIGNGLQSGRKELAKALAGRAGHILLSPLIARMPHGNVFL